MYFGVAHLKYQAIRQLINPLILPHSWGIDICYHRAFGYRYANDASTTKLDNVLVFYRTLRPQEEQP